MNVNQQSNMASSPALQQKSLTFPAPSVQNHVHHQSASTGMPTSVLTSLKKSLQQHHHHQQQQQQHSSSQSISTSSGVPSFSPSTTSHSISTPSLSPDSALDIDMPLSPTNRQTSSSSTSGLMSGSTNQMRPSSSSSSSNTTSAAALAASTTTKEPSRRVGHIHAEQKRRYNIKNGFDMLHSLIPQLQQNPNAKVKNA